MSTIIEEKIRNLYIKFVEGKCSKKEVELILDLLKNTEHQHCLPEPEHLKDLPPIDSFLHEEDAKLILNKILKES